MTLRITITPDAHQKLYNLIVKLGGDTWALRHLKLHRTPVSSTYIYYGQRAYRIHRHLLVSEWCTCATLHGI